MRDAPQTLLGPERRTPGDRIWVFADEAKRAKGCPWLYIGATLLREREVPAVVSDLVSLCNGYEGELHFHEVSNVTKRQAATAWVELALFDRRIRFTALAVRTDKLQRAAFGAGGSELQRRIHTRFVRTAIASAAKSFFGPGVRLGGVVHDFGHDLERDLSFTDRTSARLEQTHGISVDRTRTILLSSDHRTAGDNWRSARLLQLTDILLGATRQCMEDTSSKEHVRHVAGAWLPVVERLTDPRRRVNRQSRYGHVGRLDLTFFPSRSLTVQELSDPLQRAESKIFRDREPAMTRPGQLRFGAD